MVYSVSGPDRVRPRGPAVSADRYRGVAPLPALGGVARELAVDQVADHRVALARIPAGPRGALAGELLRRVGQTRHPSLAPVLDTVVDPDGAVLHVEAQADGPLLSTAVRMPQTSVVLVAADVAGALAQLHAAGLAHGGLVADAVVLDASGRPLVMGAGLAGAAAIADGRPQPAAADDLRALGRLLYLLLTGREPAAQPAAPAALAADVTPALNGLTLALLSADPERPPPPAQLVAERLRALAGVSLPAALAPPEPVRPPQPVAPKRGLSDAALAAIVGGLALLAIALALATTDTGLLGDDEAPADEQQIPTFTLPEADTLTLTVTGDELPLPDVLTDTAPIDTAATVPTETFEIFTDTVPVDTTADATATVQDTGAATDIVTLTG